MLNRIKLELVLTAVALLSFGGIAWTQTTVNYGRITAVNLVTEQNGTAQGLRARGLPVEVVHIVDLLDRAYAAAGRPEAPR